MYLFVWKSIEREGGTWRRRSYSVDSFSRGAGLGQGEVSQPRAFAGSPSWVAWSPATSLTMKWSGSGLNQHSEDDSACSRQHLTRSATALTPELIGYRTISDKGFHSLGWLWNLMAVRSVLNILVVIFFLNDISVFWTMWICHKQNIHLEKMFYS